MDRPEFSLSLRQSLQDARQSLAADYRAQRNPGHYLAAHSAVVDDIVTRAWHGLELGNAGALIAVGGYGRGQLFPGSDIDLLILLPATPDEALTARLERLIGLMWDIGLDVGHSVRTVEQCLEEAGHDLTVETTLLENRLLCGDAALHAELARRVECRRDPLAFLEGKVLEQQQRHLRHGSGTNLEPNVKESPGGLRDLQTILWIGKAIGLGQDWDTLVGQGILTSAEARLIKHSEKRLQMLRIELHLAARRREDRLIFDLQQQVGREAGFADTAARRASEQLMQSYYRAARTVSQLNDILLANLRARIVSPAPRVTRPLDARFYEVNGMLGVARPALFDEDPSAIFEAFLHLQRHPELTGIAPRTLRGLWHARRQINERFRKNPRHRQLFLQIFREPGLTRTLRRMNLYGVLGKYLPAFGKIIGQMQHDLFHAYTVDEHILMVVRNLRRFAVSAFSHEYPLMSRLISDFERPEVLYVAGLFHDIAKGRGGDHSRLGMDDARQFCQQHGLSPDDTELVTWLVGEHLTMSSVAQKQDIYDPDTVEAFARRVQTPRRLTALYLLTVADIRGTSPKVWNAWKAKLLEDLFHATLRALSNGGQVDKDSVLEERQRGARTLLRLFAVPDGVEQALWKQLDTLYFLRHEAQEIAWHARVLNRFVASGEPIVRARLSEDREGIQVLVYTPDQPQLFARLCAFFGKANYSIADAKVYTTAHGYALDTFHVFIPEHHDDYRDMINFIEFELRESLVRQDPPTVPQRGRLDRHLKHFPITPQVALRADDRARYHVLSIVSGDRQGLLARIACVMADYQLTVHSAKIMTLGSRVEDSFQLSGAALADDKTVLALEADLLAALQP